MAFCAGVIAAFVAGGAGFAIVVVCCAALGATADLAAGAGAGEVGFGVAAAGAIVFTGCEGTIVIIGFDAGALMM